MARIVITVHADTDRVRSRHVIEPAGLGLGRALQWVCLGNPHDPAHVRGWGCVVTVEEDTDQGDD